MSNYDETDLMLRYIHESIKRDCERHIMMNRISLGLPTPRSVIDETIKSSEIPFIDPEKATINESDLKGFEPGKLNQTCKLIFPRDTYVKSWFWVKMMATLMMEKYREKERQLLLKDMSNHNKLNISNVIWWNYPIFLYAVGKLKEYEIDTYPDDYDWDFAFTVCQIFDLEYGKDVTIWGETLRHFGKTIQKILKYQNGMFRMRQKKYVLICQMMKSDI